MHLLHVEVSEADLVGLEHVGSGVGSGPISDYSTMAEFAVWHMLTSYRDNDKHEWADRFNLFLASRRQAA